MTTETLGRYWGRLGFEELRDTGGYTLDLAYKRPTPPKLLTRARAGRCAPRSNPAESRTRH
jgi:hypothetical protein